MTSSFFAKILQKKNTLIYFRLSTVMYTRGSIRIKIIHRKTTVHFDVLLLFVQLRMLVCLQQLVKQHLAYYENARKKKKKSNLFKILFFFYNIFRKRIRFLSCEELYKQGILQS